MAKAKKEATTPLIDFNFFTALTFFMKSRKLKLRSKYKNISKQFLYFNEENGFLRAPQLEALEMYIFIKELLDNKDVSDIFEEWANRGGIFNKRENRDNKNNMLLVDIYNKEEYQKIYDSLKKHKRDYSNYIFSLTMGTGKTILIATCIFYEFLLANKYPKDKRFCHNALVLAPDKTVLDSLKEIFTFDKSKVVPSEYLKFLDANLKIHFLSENGELLTIISDSKFNVIISNNQKIIIKNKRKKSKPIDKLYNMKAQAEKTLFKDLYGDSLEEEDLRVSDNLIINQRFEKIIRLTQLGVYVDEAHHLYGKDLMKDLQGDGKKEQSSTTLRSTIDYISKELSKRETNLVACYNFTGTPYVENKILPEVVYSYGLRDAIDSQFLKKMKVDSYENIKEYEFIKSVLSDFFKIHSEKRYEGLLPKIAFYASKVDELEDELRPLIERALDELEIPLNKILVNVGDPKITKSEDIREFQNLDTPTSEKQVILLVNKGKEGWNCRSLFSVALYRKPSSTIFILQATMRCLRSIGKTQETGKIYLSKDNVNVLDDELNKNFRMGIKEVEDVGSEKIQVEVKIVPPPKKIKIKKVIHHHTFAEKNEKITNVDFQLKDIDFSKYEIILTSYDGLELKNEEEKTITTVTREKKHYSKYMLVNEISNYLNLSCLLIENLLKKSEDTLPIILEKVNEYNEIIYDIIIPKLFDIFYEIKVTKEEIEEEVLLVKEPKDGAYKLYTKEGLYLTRDAYEEREIQEKSFNVDTYCFDSKKEKTFFEKQIINKEIKNIYFTGMFAQGQSDFYVQYIDPETITLRKYYPDFFIEMLDGKTYIVEVKGEHMIDSPVVKAKEIAAQEIAAVNTKFEYILIPSNDVDKYCLETKSKNTICFFENLIPIDK